MCKLIQVLNKYVFYDCFVSWCAVTLLLLFKACRDAIKRHFLAFDTGVSGSLPGSAGCSGCDYGLSSRR